MRTRRVRDPELKGQYRHGAAKRSGDKQMYPLLPLGETLTK